ncbi:MAG: hypothetical protein ACRD2R_03270 [Terriglobales bacterium]
MGAVAKGVAVTAAEFAFFLSFPLVLMGVFWTMLDAGREPILAFLLR